MNWILLPHSWKSRKTSPHTSTCHIQQTLTGPLSYDYYNATQDADFFAKYSWVKAVENVLKVADEMMVSTYHDDGFVQNLTYTWKRPTDSATETQANLGRGSPFNNLTGLVRSFFRPSDDATIYQGFIPANMMFARFLEGTAPIAAKIGQTELSGRMTNLAASIRRGIEKWGVVDTPAFGKIYAFEVDGKSLVSSRAPNESH